MDWFKILSTFPMAELNLKDLQLNCYFITSIFLDLINWLGVYFGVTIWIAVNGTVISQCLLFYFRIIAIFWLIVMFFYFKTYVCFKLLLSCCFRMVALKISMTYHISFWCLKYRSVYGKREKCLVLEDKFLRKSFLADNQKVIIEMAGI